MHCLQLELQVGINVNRKANSFKIRSFAVLAVAMGMFLCACDPASAESTALPSDTTPVSETTQDTSETAPESAASDTSATTTTSATTVPTESEITTFDPQDIDLTSETTIDPDRNLGYGSYGFMMGNLEFHSQTDVSMLIEQEDATIYDFGARTCNCSWIDAYYLEDTFDMTAYDPSFRFLSFYNDDTSIVFSGYREIGTWTTPKGSELELYITEITIISDNLEIHILPQKPSETDLYNVSICGRGYYASKDQLQMADFVLSSLMEEPGVDPLEGVVTGVNHTYYF